MVAEQHGVTPALEWGIKQSFLRYLDGMPDARRSVSDGAELTEHGEYRFVLEDSSGFDPAAGLGVMKFRGDVRFSAHQGMLFVMIADPWVEIGAGGSLLTVIDAQGLPGRHRRMPIAVLGAPEPDPSRPGSAASRASLTEPGVDLFNRVYPLGESLEPLRLVTLRRSAPA